jgi:ABC-type bacteriocin/lantibiotic exporter with double-glycine peptidase domain
LNDEIGCSALQTRNGLHLSAGLCADGAYLGQDVSEKFWASALRTVDGWGTLPEEAENALVKLGYSARWFENATVERLQQLLANNFPVILFLRAVDLPHGQSGLHAVVAINLNDHNVICLDPLLEQELWLELQTFQRIWSNLDCQGMVIWK